MQISQLSNPMEKTGRSFHFGLDTAKVSAALRGIADAIDAHEVILQSAITYGRSDHDSYAFEALVLKFCAQHEASPALRELRGAGSTFPVDVVSTEKL